MNKETALATLEPITQVSSKRIEHNAGTRVVLGDEEMALRPGNHGRSLAIAPAGFASLNRMVGIPPKIQEDVSRDTLGTVATELLQHRGSYTVITREGEIVDFTNSNHQNMTPNRVLTVADKAMGGDVDFNRVEVVGPDQAFVEAVGYKEEALATNDLVRAGVVIKFSTIGSIAPYVQSFAVCQWCMNGATHDNVIRELKGYGEGDNAWQWFRQSVRECYRGFKGILRQYRDMMNHEVAPEERAELLEALLKMAHIPPEIAAAVRTRALAAPPENAFDVFQLVTYATSHDVTDTRVRMRSRVGTARFANETEHRRVCPSCHRERGGEVVVTPTR